MESLLKEHIVDHLDKNTQHEFMKKKLCLTNLLEYLETVQNNTDLGDSLDVIYLDFAKAFDKVSLRKLAKALESHGIRGNILK